jgi:serine/alanine adding enzyme
MSAPALSLAAPAASSCETVTSRAEWESLFARAPLPHFPQAWCYGEGKKSEGWRATRLVFVEQGTPVAVCQLLVKKRFGIPVTRINRGPVFLDEQPSRETKLAVLRTLRRRWRFGLNGALLIAPALHEGTDSTALLREAGFLFRDSFAWGSALIDLTPEPDAILAGVSSKWRNRFRNSLKAGLVLRVMRGPEGLDWMLEKHAENMRIKGFVGPGPAFVRTMVESSPQDFIVLQALLNDEPVCGVMAARFGRFGETYLSWTNDAGRDSNAHHFLNWHVMLELKNAGCRTLDLGGFSTNEKYGSYKRHLNGREYRLSGEWLAF